MGDQRLLELRVSRLTAVGALLLLVGAVGAVQPQQAPVNRGRQVNLAQPVQPGSGENKDDTFTSSARLPPNQKAKRKLDMAQQYLKSQDWTQAIKLLQTLLNENEDSFLAGDGSTRRLSVRAEANRLLGGLPKEGLQFYEQEYGAPARLLLKQGQETGDPQAYAEVALRYLHTEAGAEAAALLGAYHLDQGQYITAALCFERLQSRAGGLASLSPLLLYKAALAFERSGDAAARDRAWLLLEARLDQPGEPPLPASLQKLSRSELRARLQGKGDVRLAAKTDNWPMYLGSPDRTAQGVGSAPYLEPRLGYPLDTTRSLQEAGGPPEAAKSWLDQMVRKQLAMNYPILCGSHPIAVGDLLVYRGARGLHAVNIKTGKLEWEGPSGVSLAAMTSARSGLDANNQVRSWLEYWKDQFPWIFYDNTLIGTLSTDQTLVYAIEDLALPPPTDNSNRGFPNPGGMRGGGAIAKWYSHNKLVAYDLAGAGAVWEIGSSDGESPFVETFFLGCPLPLADKLYVLAETNGEIRLLCLQPQRTWNSQANRYKHSVDLVWSQLLCQPQKRITDDPLRRAQAVHLAYSDGILVCPTHAGLVIGVDLLTRSLVWAHAYQQQEGSSASEAAGIFLPPGGRRPVMINGNLATYAQSSSFKPSWGVAAPMIAGGVVVFTAPDGKFVHAVALKDGVELWRHPLKNEPKAIDLYLGGIVERRVLIVNQSSVRALDLQTGNALWTVATGTPNGRGVASDALFYLPVRTGDGKNLDSGEVWAIDVAKGQVTGKSASKLEAPGNLIFHDGEMISQSVHKVVVYPQLSAKEAEITARLKDNPRDSSGLAQRGELRCYRGDWNAARSDLLAALGQDSLPAPERQRAREKLFDTLCTLLDVNFEQHEADLPELRKLVVIEPLDGDSEETKRKRAEEQLDRQARLLRLVGNGRKTQGRMSEALAAYREFASLGSQLITNPDDATLPVVPYIWAQGRVEAMLSSAGAAQKQELEGAFEKAWQAAQKATGIEPLRQFVEFYAPICVQGREAQLVLAERYLADKQFLAAETWLIRAVADADPTRAARAHDALARLYTALGELENAAYYYKLLAQKFPKVVVRDGKTGEQLYLDLTTDKRFLPYLSSLDGTRRGLSAQAYTRIELLEPRQIGREAGRMLIPLEPGGPVAPLFEKLRMGIDGQRQVQVTDRATNEVRRSFVLPQNLLMPNTLPLRFTCSYQPLGQMLVFACGNYVYAYDLISGRVLWSQDLLGGYEPPSNNYGGYTQLQLGAEPNGRFRLFSPHGTQEWVGMLGIVEPTGVCYTMKDRGLVMVEPLSGKERWVKTDVPTSVDVFGDGEYVFIVPRGEGASRQTQAMRVLDGSPVVVPAFAETFDNRLRTIGRYLLLRDVRENSVTLRLYDPLTGKNTWTLPLGNGGIVLNSLDRRVAGGVDANGKLTVLEVSTGKILLNSKVDAASLKDLAENTRLKELNQIHLLSDSDSWYVFFNEQQQPTKDQSDPVIKRDQGQNGNQMLRTVEVNGPAYAFDRRTGAQRWQTRLPLQALMFEQFDELPVILCTGMFRRWQTADRVRQGHRYYSSVLALDKRDGKEIDKPFERDGNPYVDLRLDPAQGAFELVGYNCKVPFQLLGDTAAK